MMPTRICFAAALLAVLFAVQDVRAADDGDNVNEEFVTVLTDSNFDKNVKKGTIWLVEFYAPWCGHCKHLKPVWAEAARVLAQQNAPTKLAKVDATENPALTRRYSIQGYPTIKIFKDGKFKGDYDGARSQDAIVSFAKQASGSAVRKLGEDDSIRGFVDEQEISFLLVGVAPDNKLTISSFFKVGDDEAVINQVGFAQVDSAAAFAEYLKDEGFTTQVPIPALVVVNTGELAFVSSRGDAPVKLDEASMREFIVKNKVPFFPELSPNKNWALTKQGKKAVLAFVDKSSDATEPFLETMKSLNRQLRDKLVIGWVDAPSNTFLLAPVGLTLGALPKFVVVDIPEMTYYSSPWLTDEAEIKAYLERVAAGKETANPIEEKRDGKDEEKPKAAAAGSGASSEAVTNLERKVDKLEGLVAAQQSAIARLELWWQLTTAVGGFVLLFVLVLAARAESKTRRQKQEPASAPQEVKKRK